MSIKAIFPAGVTALTVNGLHQWDYGQQLEIVAPDLPAMVEVHFACLGMQSAEVRTCSAVSGTLLAAIPDLCLEQTAPIIAWVYAINGAEGATVKTITLPIIPRVKPQIEASIPRDNTDAYTQFLTEVNNAVGSLKDGDVTVRHALSAVNADKATHANGADAVISQDATDAAGHIDKLVTAGRYYCEPSDGTPDNTYGNVEVFRRFSNTMQVFYAYYTGNIYLRVLSDPNATDKQWSEWKSVAKNAQYAESSSRISVSGVSISTVVTSPGLYLVSLLDSTSNVYLTDWIFIPALNQIIKSASGNTHYQDGRLSALNGCDFDRVIRIGDYTPGGIEPV